MYEISVVPSVDSFGSAAFADLDGPDRFPFLRHAWLDAFEKTECVGGKSGWFPRHLRIRRGQETLAFCPAYVKTNSFGEFVFDHAIADFAESRLGLAYYPKLILAVPFTPASGPRLLFAKGSSEAEREEVLSALVESLPRLCRELRVSSAHVLFPQAAQAEQLVARGMLHRRGLQFQFQNHGYGDFSDFLATFRAKRRAVIRRERRELAEGPLRIRELTGPSLRELNPKLAYELYLTTVDKFVWGRRYLTEQFFERVLCDMPDAIHFVLAEDATGPRAGAFNLLGEEALYGRYWGSFGEVKYLHFEVCLYRGIDAAIRLGRARFEPGAGGEHKESRGFKATLTHSTHHFEDSRLARAVGDYFAREAEALEARSAGDDD